jgi:hypothetical protein
MEAFLVARSIPEPVESTLRMNYKDISSILVISLRLMQWGRFFLAYDSLLSLNLVAG